MKHISKILAAILPFRLDNIRDLTPTDRTRLQEQVKRWTAAKYFCPVR